MRVFEFAAIDSKYKVTVRVVDGSTSFIANLTLNVNGISQAWIIAAKLFGYKNVISITEVRGELIEDRKTLSSDQLRIKSLKDQEKRYGELAKREKARQGLAQAQKTMQNVRAASTN